jgi:hypothetical protein
MSGEASPKGRIKGVAFGEFVAWYARTHGTGHLDDIVTELDARYPSTFDPERDGYGILASRWYPAHVVHDLLDGITAEHASTELDRMAQLAADAIMARTLKGVYKFLFSTFASPELYAKHVSKLWALHYDSGRVVLEPGGPNTWSARYEHWAGHHPFICRMNMASSVAIYGAMGCRNVTWSKTACISDGDPACGSRIHYES